MPHNFFFFVNFQHVALSVFSSTISFVQIGKRYIMVSIINERWNVMNVFKCATVLFLVGLAWLFQKMQNGILKDFVCALQFVLCACKCWVFISLHLCCRIVESPTRAVFFCNIQQRAQRKYGFQNKKLSSSYFFKICACLTLPPSPLLSHILALNYILSSNAQMQNGKENNQETKRRKNQPKQMRKKMTKRQN